MEKRRKVVFTEQAALIKKSTKTLDKLSSVQRECVELASLLEEATLGRVTRHTETGRKL